MTFDAFEKSVESSRPVEVYRFTLGATTYEFTPSEDTVTVNSLDYEPTAIKRGKILQSPEDRDTVVDFTVEGSNAFAINYINIIPAAAATVTVQRVQRADYPGPEVVTLYEGVVSSVKFTEDGHIAQIATQSIESAKSRIIPRYTYQGLCNAVLYDDQCKVDDTDSTFRLSNASVLSVTGNTIVVQGADGQSNGYWTGGFVETGGGTDARLILTHTGTSLGLLLPFPSDLTGSTVTVLAGCDHTISTCHTKFFTTEDNSSNVINYAGFHFVPTRDIFRTGLQ